MDRSAIENKTASARSLSQYYHELSQRCFFFPLHSKGMGPHISQTMKKRTELHFVCLKTLQINRSNKKNQWNPRVQQKKGKQLWTFLCHHQYFYRVLLLRVATGYPIQQILWLPPWQLLFILVKFFSRCFLWTVLVFVSIWHAPGNRKRNHLENENNRFLAVFC